MKIRSIKFNFIMNFILTSSSVIFPLITFPYVSRVLMADGNGKIAFASSVITYFTMFASLGIPTYGIRACAKVRDDYDKLSKTAQELLIINSMTMMLTMLVYVLVLIFVPKFYAEKELFIINGIGMLLNMFAMNWLYNALEQYAHITFCNLATKIIALSLMFLLVKNSEDYIIYGGITMFASSVSYVYNFVHARKFISFKKAGKYEFKIHLRPILIFFAMSAATSVYTNLDVVMLGFMKTDADVGFYNAAIKVKTILVTLITSLGTVLLPRLSYYMKKGEKDLFQKTIGKATNFVAILGVPLMVYFMLYAKESILFLAGDGYQGAILPMIILMPTIVFIGLSNITGIQILTPQNKEKEVLYSILVGAAADFLLNILLISKFAAAGAAFATVVAELLVLVVQCIYLRDDLLGIVKQVSWGKILVATVFASVAGIILKISIELSAFFMLAISATAFFGVYGIVLLITKEKFVTEILASFIKTSKKRERG